MPLRPPKTTLNQGCGPALGPTHCTQLRPVSNTAVPNWMRSVPAYPATKVKVYGTLDDPEFARRTLSMNTTLLSLYLHVPGYLPLLTVPEMNRRLQYMQAEPSAALVEAFDWASFDGEAHSLGAPNPDRTVGWKWAHCGPCLTPLEKVARF